jgi:hypothetical protein
MLEFCVGTVSQFIAVEIGVIFIKSAKWGVVVKIQSRFGHA